MIRTFEVLLNAAHPDLPILEATTIVGSASTAIIRGVPVTIGAWKITKVYAQVSYPDGVIVTQEAVQSAAGVWTATVPMTLTSGRVKSGFTVLADGTDEHGEAVSGYVLGIGDFAVYTRDLTVNGGTTQYTLHYFDEAPASPKIGDVAPIDGALRLYDGSEWIAFAGGGSDIALMEEITWAELRSKCIGGTLVPGQQYRITDYVATVGESYDNARSANHPYDIIVTADSESTLSERARAIAHDGDTYFAGCKMEAWQVWFCLDNDTSRFAWADATNGKGVVYRLIDEWRNDCPYDFKGIQYLAYGDSDGVWRYTFDSGLASGNTDLSLIGGAASSGRVYNNTIGARPTYDGALLPCIVFKGSNCRSNTFESGCYNNTFGSGCYNNSFGGNFHNSTFGNSCRNNTFKSDCYNITFGDGCYNNNFKHGCRNNTFGGGCYNNTFGGGCYNNTFGANCYNNTFGANYRSNTFGNDCYNNSFGSTCYNIIFGDSCFDNSLGDRCSSNTFGANCYHIIFGASHMSNITIEAGVQYVNLVPMGEPSSSAPYRYVTIASGVHGTSASSKVIEDPNVGQTYKTTYQAEGSEVITV